MPRSACKLHEQKLCQVLWLPDWSSFLSRLHSVNWTELEASVIYSMEAFCANNSRMRERLPWISRTLRDVEIVFWKTSVSQRPQMWSIKDSPRHQLLINGARSWLLLFFFFYCFLRVYSISFFSWFWIFTPYGHIFKSFFSCSIK